MLDASVSHCEGNHVRTVAGPGLETDVIDMSLDGPRCYSQLFGDLLGRKTRSGKTKDMEFSSGQGTDPLGINWIHNLPPSYWPRIICQCGFILDIRILQYGVPALI